MRALTIGILVALLLAGCAGKPKDAATQGPSDSPESTLPKGVTNILEGTVRGVDLTPLEAVNITLDGSNQTRDTDGTGYYRFESLDPRDYIVIARKDGWKPKTQRAVVEDQKLTQLDFVLDSIPVAKPYNETQPFNGFISCQTHYQTSEGAPMRQDCNNGADSNNAQTHNFPIGSGAAQIVIEVVWEKRTNAATQLSLSALTAGDPQVELGYTHSEPTLRVVISEAITRKYFGNGGELRTFVQAGPSIAGDESAADVGVAIQQPYTIYLTTFYIEPGPPTFTFVPE